MTAHKPRKPRPRAREREIIYPGDARRADLARRNPRWDASLPTGVAFFQQNR
jgi:hypothetical protein